MYYQVAKIYYNNSQDGCHGKYPVGIISIEVPQNTVDINLEPNKNKVNLQNEVHGTLRRNNKNIINEILT